MPLAESSAAINAQMLVVVMLETPKAIENADAIAAVPGVDGLWIGHVDLTASLGCPGDFADPRFVRAVDRIVAAAKKHNLPLGRLVGSVEEGLRLHAQGFDFIGYSGDVWILQDGLAAALDALRARSG
jgi:2-dehydro-3-deoxyglucarate aldolase/4-hydroxy-2-oxoheptanedioate aldolase